MMSSSSSSDITMSETFSITTACTADRTIAGPCEVCLLNPLHPVKMACNHVFCRDCTKSALKLSPLCPLCKKEAAPLTEVKPKETLADIDAQIAELKQKRDQLIVSKQREAHKMALEFFVESRNQKIEKLERLKKELRVVQEEMSVLTGGGGDDKLSSPAAGKSVDKPSKKKHKRDHVGVLKPEEITSNYANMLRNFHDLENNYFSTNSKYRDIGKVIYEAFKYESVTTLGKISINGTNLKSSCIYMLSISNAGLLSVAGSVDTVNLYNYSAVEDTPLPLLYPITKLPTNCSTWSTVWNPCSTNLLAVADHNGDIKVWDVTGGVVTNTFQGHTASKYLNVEWTPTKPQQVVSAGFDSVIKVWRLNERGCALNIRAPDKLLKLCCKPLSPYHLAAASIDRNIYTYDTRKPDKPVNTCSGHAKSVFQLKFLNNKTLISASIDGTLKQWSYDTCQCTRTYQGHSNSTKFIGLDVMGEEHLVCGSENNTLVLYHESLSKPILTHQFPGSRSLLGNSTGDQDLRHISAVACRGEDVCVGNDVGMIHVLRWSEGRQLKHIGTQCDFRYNH